MGALLFDRGIVACCAMMIVSVDRRRSMHGRWWSRVIPFSTHGGQIVGRVTRFRQIGTLTAIDLDEEKRTVLGRGGWAMTAYFSGVHGVHLN